ncbi:sag-related sequence srs20c [Cystoisospora suis]|uniref:Sag-related sequence srs20c n=1 Tax=Cystoisospora suis TaxID=483139 RepID=A0A2C6KW61_9APIC|nr:sag-related sequence srs20c [Cystoisospora suis]
MKLPGLSCRGAAFVLASTVGLAVGLPFFAEGRQQSEALLVSRRLEEGATGGDAAPAVQECPPKGVDQVSLDLEPTANAAVEFQCGEGSLLRPGEKELLKIYRYDAAKKTCDTANPVTLATELAGATLTAKAKGGDLAAEKSVYAFKYTTEPNEDKHLCYTCNKPAAGAGKDVPHLRSDEAGKETLACTVYIKVPKKQQEKTTTTSSTSAPTTSSGAHAMPAAIFSAVGGLLAVVLRI